jgi:WhiB family redox-sensing transcriptional regulator
VDTVEKWTWVADAACRAHPEVNFFPGRGHSTAPAKLVCEGCLVREQCLAYALADRELRGVWGGTSERERRVMRRRRPLG